MHNNKREINKEYDSLGYFILDSIPLYFKRRWQYEQNRNDTA